MSERIFDHVEFDTENFPADLICGICKCPMLPAKLLTPCGHTYCGVCIEVELAKGNPKCGKCRCPIQGNIKNICVENLLATKRGKCGGCGQEFSLDRAAEHVRQCGEIKSTCPLCKVDFRRKDEHEHRRMCPKEKVPCECGVMLDREDEVNHKSEICRFGNVACPLQCGEVLQRYLVSSHSTACGRVATKCKVDGCGQIVRKKEQENHIENELKRHWELSQRERSAMMWLAERNKLGVAAERGCQRAVFKWSIPTEEQLPSVLCSSEFQKFQRKWRLVFNKGHVLLQVTQALEQIVAFVRFVVEVGGKTTAYCSSSRVVMKEGEEISITLPRAEAPQSVTVYIEEAQPRKFNFRV